MTPPIHKSYAIRQGDAWAGETFRFISSLGVGYWTNFKARCQLRSYPEGHLVHEFDLSAAAVTSEPPNGVLTLGIFMQPASTNLLSPGVYRGDLWLQSNTQPHMVFVEFDLSVADRITAPECTC